MENRFGLKDLILLVLLVAVIVVDVCFGMKQYDRQWQVLQTMQEQQGEQSARMQDLTRTINRLATAGPRISTASQSPAVTQPADDPFARFTAAQQMPGYARGYVHQRHHQDGEDRAHWQQDAYGNAVIGRVLESLLTRDEVTLAWQPLIAASLPKISDDGLTFTFELRHDVTFSDGQPLTADDVVWTYNWMMNPLVEALRQRAYYKTLASVVQHGEYEVVFTFKEPYFKSEELAGGMQILPEHFYSKYTPDEFNKDPGLLMGSGPYRMEDPIGWSPGKPMELVRNRAIGGPPGAVQQNRLPYLRGGHRQANRVARNGEINAPDGITPEEYREMVADPDLVARTRHWDYSTPTAGYRFIAWNERRTGKPTKMPMCRAGPTGDDAAHQ